ncbi:MAG: hypothetical protein K0V04_30920, partial [Deltaproteobacteria bacterium]|nr:hypothetical protein [Deltaproteobacteria bacterium]
QSTEDNGGEDATLEGNGVRHGIRYEGCTHFELFDADAVEAWALDNKWRFAKWALKLDEVRSNPEPAVLDALSTLFPDCPWPPMPSATFGPERVGWEEAMAITRQAIAEMDLAGTAASKPGTDESGRELARVLMLGLRARPPGGQRR